MVCPERTRLAREYYIAVDAFYRSVLALNDPGEAEFHRAHEITEMYRVAVEIAREALNHHLVGHGC
jgi:hypothetical protein